MGVCGLGIDLFEAGKGGYLTYRITGLVTLADKTILAYAEARKDGNGDWADIDILMRRSVDGGGTWTESMLIADASRRCWNAYHQQRRRDPWEGQT